MFSVTAVTRVVLVQGGAGAVGACAVQLARQAGAYVIATVRSEEDEPVAAHHGADGLGPGSGPPPHVHSREEESFYILEGEITFTINGERVVATAGMFANMTVGTPHSFKNESNKPAKMLVSVAPRSQ
jgi:quercetin dioxygenase-like cupin family protein